MKKAGRDAFAKSVNNDAIYIAKLVAPAIDLKPDNACDDGDGTNLVAQGS